MVEGHLQQQLGVAGGREDVCDLVFGHGGTGEAGEEGTAFDRH
jgi:hypothetical protein